MAATTAYTPLADKDHSPSTVSGKPEVANSNALPALTKMRGSSPTRPSALGETPSDLKDIAPPNSTAIPPAPAYKPADFPAGLAVEFSEEEEAEEERGMLDSQTSRQIDRVQLFLKMDRLRRPKSSKK